MTNSSPEPLHDLIRGIRNPSSLRELMAACLRSIHMGDPFTGEGKHRVALPEYLVKEVQAKEVTCDGVPCIVYSPNVAQTSLPVIIYMHGGGFVVGCSDDTDYITRMLSYGSQAKVFSVNYRLAPEIIFPGALGDCEKVLKYVLQNLESAKLDASIYIAGDSAGANLAAALCLKLDSKIRAKISGLVLLAPWLDMAVESYKSYNRLAPLGVVFDAAFLGFARAAYTVFEDWKNPLVSPIHGDWADMPKSLMIIGAEDPFVDQVRGLQKKLAKLSCQQVTAEIFDGMPHCFYSFPNLYLEEQECFRLIQDFVKSTSS